MADSQNKISFDAKALEEQINRLQLSRRAHRGQLTKLLTQGTNVSTNLEDADNLQCLEGLLDSIDTKIRYLCELDTHILSLTGTENLESSIIECDDYIEKNKAHYRRLNKLFRDGQAERPRQQSTRNENRRVNLPKLSLPYFSGDVLSWTSFIETFRSSIDNDETLDKIQKFQYLKGQLKGEAAGVIVGLPLSNQNYDQAMALLEKRYGQPHKIINSYMKTLWELPKPGDSPGNLKDFHDKIESCVRGLDALGKSEDAYGDLLVPILFERLPGKVRSQISRDLGDTAWTLTQLRESIYKEIQTQQTTWDTDNMEEPSTSTSTFHIGSKKSPKVIEKPMQRPACAFCKGEHRSAECLRVNNAQRRLEIAVRDKLCLNCLKKGHRAKDCRCERSCFKCHRRHHTALCGATFQKRESREQTQEPRSQEAKAPKTHVSLTPTSTHNTGPVLLKTAQGSIRNRDGRSVQVNILFDEGAQRTFITENVIKQMNMKCNQKESIHLSTFGTSSTSVRHVDVAELIMETREGPVDISALVVSRIATPMKNYVKSAVTNHPYLQNLELAQHVERDNFNIDLLIGADFYWTIVGDNTVRGPGPTAVSSKLGYLLSGPSGSGNTEVMSTMVYHITTPPLAEYWSLETVGIRDDMTEKSTLDDFRRDLKKRDDKYVAPLPWADNHPPLPTNFNIAEKRTRALVKKMKTETRRIYDGIINEQKRRGFIEMVEDDDITRGHYIPHHAVHKDSTTTPLRIVYDCSCKVGDNPSLNDCLEVGPNLAKDLVQILLRFRTHSVGFTSDIEKAFLNIELEEKDRQYTKFLWLEDPEDPDSNLVTYQFKSVLFGSASSPFILNAVIKIHLEATPDDTASDMLENTYVDNLVSGTPNSQQAVEYYMKSTKTMKEGGFNLRSWATNDPTLRTATEEDGKQDPDPSRVKVLGLCWDTTEDRLNYTLEHTQETKDITKRVVVSLTSKLFDPLGLLSPVHITAKIFIQKLWTLELGWDEPLTKDLSEEWRGIQEDLQMARDISLQRPYFTSSNGYDGEFELHMFADSSSEAYGAVAYLKRGKECAFVMAKSRVKPLKEITIPRLELLAAYVASLLASFILGALHRLKIHKKVLWSDSQIVLHWINSEKKLPRFVENRVKTIRDTRFDAIKYCPTDENPADLLTRGVSAKRLKNSTLWMYGPTWLPDGDWPICSMIDSKILACQLEQEKAESDAPQKKPALSEKHGIEELMDIERFSTLEKLLRVTAYVMRFIKRARKQSSQASTRDLITVAELKQARDLWIRSIQKNTYPQELQDMKDKRRKNTLVRQLKLFVDEDGLVRCGGRLHNAPIGLDSKHPILIPREHNFTSLVIQWAHLMVLHAGVEVTAAFIRNTFWVPRIRQILKSKLRSCVTCKKVQGKPYRSPDIPPLPKCRLEEAPSFTITGIDFTGALFYRSATSTSNKAYICLFTCAVTRAIHLEVVTDMTTGSFLRAFRRFAARRSLPTVLLSDNGSTFLSSVVEIRKICKDDSVHNYLAGKNIEWRFIPKRAPWFGGFYERLIGITKNALKKSLLHKLVTLDELTTLCAEVEAVINDRPITYTSAAQEEPMPLTPSMLLQGRRSTILPHLDISEEELKDADFGTNETALQRRAKEMDHLFTHMWLRWKKEYLPALRETHMHNAKKQKGEASNNIRVGDVVLVHEDNHKRSQWPLAVVTELKFGNDGLVRSAEVRMKGGVSNRPIVKLYPLEVNSCSYHQNPKHDDSEQTLDSDGHIQTSTRRPLRQAANRAGTLIKEWAKQLV